MEIGFSRKTLSLIAGVLLILSTTFAVGQGITTGSISGTVEDQQRAVVAGATVTATNAGTNQQFTTTTNSQGFFTLRTLPAGMYTVTIEAPKFTRLKISDVGVNASRDSALGARTLSIGTAEVVTVEGGTPLVESTTSQVSSTFDTKQVADLPLGSGFDMLAYFSPGVASAGSNGFSNNNGADISVNGQRGRSNNFQIDGQANNDNSVAGPGLFLSNQDLIAEFNVITNNFGVEYGRNSGSVVNYVTKQGTNAFHGTGFWYHTSNAFDSYTNQEKNPLLGFCLQGQDPLATGCTPIERIPKYIDNRYGGTLGGPIWKDKAWFFGSYYGDRERGAGTAETSQAALTPTPAGVATLAANFPGSPGVAILQAIGPHAVTAGNPSVLSVAPAPILVNGVPIEVGTITRQPIALYNEYEISGRGDVQVTSKDRVYGRYIIDDTIDAAATGRFAAGAYVDVPARAQQAAFDWTRSFTSTFVNQARISYARTLVGFEGGSFPDCIQANILVCPTNINFTPANLLDFGMQNNLPQGRLVNNTQFQSNASWVRGKNTTKFGGEYSRQRSPSVFLPSINGTYNFASLQNFINNAPTTLNLTDGPTQFNFKEQDAAWYVGNDWRVKDNLTLNFGVRWEFFQQAVNLLHDLTVANQARAVPVWDPSIPTNVTQVPRIPEDYNNFAPSVGFAWTPRIWQGLFGQEKTVFRGGFRINYEPAYYNIFLNIATSAPVVNAGTVPSGVALLPATGFTGADVRNQHLGNIPSGIGINPGVRNRTEVDPDFHNPYTENWHFGFQRQLSNSLAWETRYVGNHTVGNFQTIDANPQVLALATDFPGVVPAGVTACNLPGSPGFASGRADCAFTNVRRRTNTAFSIYHGLQNELRIRNWNGLNAGFSYTFSKTIDNVSEIFSTATAATTVAAAQNPFDVVAGERGVSGLDFPHVATLYFSYELPWYKNQGGFAGHLLGGWQVSPTWRYTSGQNYTPSQLQFGSYCGAAFSLSLLGVDTCRPFTSNPDAPIGTVGLCTDASLADCGLVNFATGDPIAASSVHFIANDDTAATFFGTPFGNTPRHPGTRGQATNTVNMNVLKTTKLTERLSLRFEAQAFNLFNHQFRGNPDPFIESCGFQDRTAAGCAGAFANNFFNDSGGDFSNVVINGISRRRLTFGLKMIF